MNRLRNARWRMLTLLVILTGGCDLPGKPREADRPTRRRTRSRLLTPSSVCGCVEAAMGRDGKLGPAPSLNDPVFLAIVPDAELRHVISEGRKGRNTAAAQEERDAGFRRGSSGGPLI